MYGRVPFPALIKEAGLAGLASSSGLLDFVNVAGIGGFISGVDGEVVFVMWPMQVPDSKSGIRDIMDMLQRLSVDKKDNDLVVTRLQSFSHAQFHVH